MKKRIKLKLLLLIIVLITSYRAIPQKIYKNKGESISFGKTGSGKLINAYKMPYKGKNYRFFNPLSYYVLGRSYVHSKVCNTITSAYDLCKEDCPEKQFRLMESSNKKGGKIFPHITHQNGLSVDFMTPLIKDGKQKKFYDRIGIRRYLMNFNSEGMTKINNDIEIDFNTMPQHIINLDKAAKKSGLRIKKVIFKINLQDDLFKTEVGKKLKKRNVYFVKHLSDRIDKLHDDYYHIDFALVK